MKMSTNVESMTYKHLAARKGLLVDASGREGVVSERSAAGSKLTVPGLQVEWKAGCCEARRARSAVTIYEYLQRAFRRPPAPLPPGAAWCHDGDRNLVAFGARLECGRIIALGYRSTTCATLLALCEHLAEMVPGMTSAEALAYSAEDLLALHPEIPAGRRARAYLAVRALHAGLSLSL